MTVSSRIPAMDVLRGCAVMGILWMNITAFAQPQSAYINPAAAGPLTTGDIAFWAISLILVDGKMRGLFTLLFGAGLAISGMIDPARVRAFLDVTGAWDPTLAFVMAGAILPMAIAWFVVRRHSTPIAAEQFHSPATSPIDRRLIGGAAGAIQKQIGYDGFFLLSGALSFAAIFFLPIVMRARPRTA